MIRQGTERMNTYLTALVEQTQVQWHFYIFTLRDIAVPVIVIFAHKNKE